MNERIKELAEEFAMHTETMTGIVTDYVFDLEELERFAELIVEEYSKDTKALEIALEALRKIASFKGDNVMISKEAIYKIERLNQE